MIRKSCQHESAMPNRLDFLKILKYRGYRYSGTFFLVHCTYGCCISTRTVVTFPCSIRTTRICFDIMSSCAVECGVRAPQSYEICKILYSRMSPRFEARAIAVRYEIRSNFAVQLHSQVFHHTRSRHTSKYNRGKSDEDSRYDTCRNSTSLRAQLCTTQ